jgi:signal transduction histidine kinase
MAIESARVLRLLGDFAEPDRRPAAAADLARALGAEELILFAPDPELGVLLPAPGLPQTLRNAAEWRTFLEHCRRDGEFLGELSGPDGHPRPARGCTAAGGVVAVAVGEHAAAAELASLRPLFSLLGALFRSERQTAAAEVRVTAAGRAVERAEALTQALQEMRTRLEAALQEAEAARSEARAQAEQAETLAEELQTQATHLEEQAAALEELNAELAASIEEAERARAAADVANRAKSEFLATMSHELRTPINAIIGYTELLEMGISGAVTDEQRAQLERIRSSSRHLLSLINDVLDLAKIEAGHMTVTGRHEPVGEVLFDTVGMLALQAAERGIEVEEVCGDPNTAYVGDEDRVRQIVVNLLSNAIKFTEPGGRVLVRCGCTPQPQPDAQLTGTGPWTYIQVEDSGIGIAANELDKVFLPFVQAEVGHSRTRGGTGLGLTISRQLARLMGGDLTVRSEPGQGSCFTLWLPTEKVPGTLDETLRVGADRAGSHG